MNLFILLLFFIFCHTLSEKRENNEEQALQEEIDNCEETDDREASDDVVYIDEVDVNDRLKKDAKVWDHWGKWTPCTVSCGVGKMTRWRHCISEACSPGEKEAQIKTCKKKPC